MVTQSSINRLFDNQLWSVERLSTYLGTSVATVRYWVYMRKIPFLKVGKHIRFRFEPDIKDWLEERNTRCR